MSESGNVREPKPQEDEEHIASARQSFIADP